MGSLFDRFTNKVEWPSVITACWPWKAGHDRYGYGYLQVDGAKKGSHRVAYELFRGPIPDGMHIDHLCRVRNCVNPLHLEAVPKVINDLRGNSLQAMNARKTHCAAGHPFSESNTYRWVRRGRTERACRACNANNARRSKARRKERLR